MNVLSVLGEEDIRRILREELASLLSQTPNNQPDEIGKGAEYAASVTGFTVSTIYSLVSRGEIPFSKRANSLFFSRKQLEDWLLKRKNV